MIHLEDRGESLIETGLDDVQQAGQDVVSVPE